MTGAEWKWRSSRDHCNQADADIVLARLRLYVTFSEASQSICGKTLPLLTVTYSQQLSDVICVNFVTTINRMITPNCFIFIFTMLHTTDDIDIARRSTKLANVLSVSLLTKLYVTIFSNLSPAMLLLQTEVQRFKCALFGSECAVAHLVDVPMMAGFNESLDPQDLESSIWLPLTHNHNSSQRVIDMNANRLTIESFPFPKNPKTNIINVYFTFLFVSQVLSDLHSLIAIMLIGIWCTLHSPPFSDGFRRTFTRPSQFQRTQRTVRRTWPNSAACPVQVRWKSGEVSLS